MSDEILNLEYHYKRLALIACNKTEHLKDAAYLLGISERTLFRWMRLYGIKKDRKNRKYYLEERKPQIIAHANF